MLFGLKTMAWFDLWSVEHVACMMWLITMVQQRLARETRPPAWRAWWLSLAISIALGYCWECVELPIELGLLGGRVKFWMAGQEYWGNRWVADTLVCVLAAFWLAKTRPWLTWVAKVYAITWLILHVIFTPHSMYLQTAEAWQHLSTWLIVGGELCLFTDMAIRMRRHFKEDYEGRPYRIVFINPHRPAPGVDAREDEEEPFP